MKECQILGLQRSGTNYTQDLITDNFYNVSVIGNNCDDFIDKHSPVPNFIQNPEYLVYVYKHPLLWIESALNSKVSNFLELLPTTEEGPKVNNISIKSLIELYNLSLNNWIVNYNQQIPLISIQYEKLLSTNGVEKFFSELESKFQFKRETHNIYTRKLGDTYHSTYDYDSNHLEKYINNRCTFLSKEIQIYILNNIHTNILKLFN